jgi:hypothetical protein
MMTPLKHTLRMKLTQLPLYGSAAGRTELAADRY